MADTDAEKVSALLRDAMAATTRAEETLAEKKIDSFILVTAENYGLKDNDSMPSITREEVNAKLEATEARMDARVAGMSSKLDAALAEMRADRETNTIRFAAMTESIREVKEQGNSLRGNVWGAAVATITIVGAIVAFGISAFDSGRETSKNIAEATARMERLGAQLEAQTKALQAMSAKAPQQR